MRWVLLILFVLPLTVNATLIRNAGKGSVSISFPTWYTLVPEDQITFNSFLNADYDFIFASRGPGQNSVTALPDDCFVMLGPDTPFEDDPCYWQFFVGEPLTLFGYSRMVLPGADIRFDWSVRNASQQWDFAASSTEVETGGPEDTTRELFFNAGMPADLLAGEYLTQIKMTLTAPDGWVFFNLNTFNPEVFCAIADELPDCYRNGNIIGDEMVLYSPTERLQVVSAPASSGLVLLGLLAIGRRRLLS